MRDHIANNIYNKDSALSQNTCIFELEFDSLVWDPREVKYTLKTESATQVFSVSL